ncbi:MAG: thioredoxin domain-containing protein, partial [Nitrospirales bacterium]
ALNHGQGGWPMTVFLTPDQEPIFAGTYFPLTDRFGRPGFGTILQKVAEFWRKDPEALRQQARQLADRMRDAMRVSTPMPVGEAELDAAIAQFAEAFDPKYGGFGSAPKFPPATGLSLLLRRHHSTGDAHTLHMVRKTLDAMAAGGMYDQIGGGFARYSTDDRWLVPHFEKMLYDNALLTRTYLEAFQVTGEANYRRVATETLDYILREMTSPEGGFYSATDADSEGVEGKFFVWTVQEIRDAPGNEEDARRCCAYYDVTEQGNWEHTNILNTPRPLADVAQSLGISAQELQATLARVRPLLYETRRRRVPPGLDDKILTGWNGMMISAMAEGARILGEDRYRRAAEGAADFLLGTLSRPDGGLYRTYRKGTAHLQACLEDYAYLMEGLIDLYEAGSAERYLLEARRLAERALADFHDREHGGFFTTAQDHERLILRSREGPDGATPSPNAVLASVLARLSFHFARDAFRDAAARAIRAYGREIAHYPRAFAKSLAVADLLLKGPVELALVGSPGEPGFEALRRAVNRPYLPNHVLASHDPSGPATQHPLLSGKGLVNGKAALYVCRNFTCQAPVTNPDDVPNALAEWGRTAEPTSQSRTSTIRGASLPGHATPDGTQRYAARFLSRRGSGALDPHAFVEFGDTGLTT